MIIHVKPDPDIITVNDLIQLQSGDTSVEFLVSLLAKMARDEYGVPLPHEDAERYLRGLSLTEFRRLVESLGQTLELETVPKATASP